MSLMPGLCKLLERKMLRPSDVLTTTGTLVLKPYNF